MQHGDTLAAIDLGSNSFRLEIGRIEHGQIVRAEYLKEMVRLGGGLDADSMLGNAAMQRGWDCLARFAERVRGFDANRVRAVATQTLREARNPEVFLERAHAVLGFPIEVVSGREEARLIYSGVAHLLPESGERRLVVDIGGRSTEVVLGRGYMPSKVESYPVGSVGLSMRHFPEGRLTAKAFDAAVLSAQAVMEGALGFLGERVWDAAYGSSGTIGAVADVLRENAIDDGTITGEGLDWLLDQLLHAGHIDRLRLAGLRDERRAVIGGGLATLRAVFSLLGVDRMQAARGALRHGVLYEMLDRRAATRDVRERTVARLQQKFGADVEQARRVRDAAQHLMAQLRPSRDAELPNLQRKLGWAAELHEIGMAVSHEDYHRHGAYILEHSDGAGFAQHQFERLGALLLGQRGGLRKVSSALADDGLRSQLLCLRLAVLLCHARRLPDLQGLRLAQDNAGARLAVGTAWAEAHPRSMFLLQEEAAHWARIGQRFEVVAG
jgi:exopolyphosphatase/guanosine-5'-triphosphate,3'-diphosphate pyrophosphatase